ncbi:hypothetical protein P3S67_014421 [Capsicum chacoense]
MELKMEGEYKKQKKSFPPPPKRGQIKIKILNSLIKSAADFVYGSKIKKGENPGESPNFYDFGTDSDKSYK